MVSEQMEILITDGHELAGLGAMRSLGKAGYRVTVASPRRWSAAARSRYCTATVVSPDPWMQQSSYRDWLAEAAQRHDLVLPITEAAMVAAKSIRNAIMPPPSALSVVLSKRESAQRAIEAGLDCPKTAFDRVTAENMQFPVIVKTDNQLTADGRYLRGHVWYIEDLPALQDLLDELEGTAWIVQEYLPGYGAGAFLLRWSGVVRLSFAHRRLHETPFWGGSSSMREGVDDPSLVSRAQQFFGAIGFEGVGMVEFRVSEGTPYFVEINGRLWGSLALALHSGADFPRALVDCWIRGETAVSAPRFGVRCRNIYPGELLYMRSVLRGSGPVRGIARPSKVRTILGLFLDHCKGDFFWVSDPLPAAAQFPVALCDFVTLFRRLVKNAFARRRGRQFALERTRHRGGPVLFLCYGNICRSPFAEALWKRRYGCAVWSAGFHSTGGRPTPQRIRRIAQEFDIDLSNHRSRVVSVDDVQRAGTIYVMDSANLESLFRLYPEAKNKARVMNIPDPYLLDDEAARESLRTLADRIASMDLVKI